MSTSPFISLSQKLPEYAKDLRLNASSLMRETAMTDQQKYGTLVACAHATGHPPLIEAAEEEARTYLSENAMNAARMAASLMAMNNIYYRFLHLCSRPDYRTMPARLRMNGIAAPGIEKVDFELICLAVSAINGCGMCIDAHEKILHDAGIAPDAIQASVRLAAVIHAIAKTLAALVIPEDEINLD